MIEGRKFRQRKQTSYSSLWRPEFYHIMTLYHIHDALVGFRRSIERLLSSIEFLLGMSSFLLRSNVGGFPLIQFDICVPEGLFDFRKLALSFSHLRNDETVKFVGNAAQNTIGELHTLRVMGTGGSKRLHLSSSLAARSRSSPSFC